MTSVSLLGSHVVHRVCKSSDIDGLSIEPIMAIYPVCKMKVEESKAPATSEYKGKKYYFCAVGCKKAFDQNPEKYLAEEKK